jgi:hypothetical protein
VKVVRYADRPDLLARRYEELTKPTFAEYMNNNEPGRRYWGRLYIGFPDFQVALVDGEEVLAEAHAIPIAWDGTLGDLPSGWDEGFTRGMKPPTGSRPFSWRWRSASRPSGRGSSCRAG